MGEITALRRCYQTSDPGEVTGISSSGGSKPELIRTKKGGLKSCHALPIQRTGPPVPLRETMRRPCRERKERAGGIQIERDLRGLWRL